MAAVSTYLNFPRTTEQAFAFYKTVFKTDYIKPIARFADMPADAGPPADGGCPPMKEADKNLVLHVALPILAGHVLMGTDCVDSMGQTYTPGNNVSINLQPDTRAEAKRLFDALSEGGKVDMPLQDMFWGDYFGALVDRFGTQWMINCSSKT
jgi:PhnB protein